MKPENILYSPWLDILFENRNKEYGAYELRNNYERRLIKAMATIVTIVILLFLLNMYLHSLPGKVNRLVNPVIPDTKLTDVYLTKDPLPLIPPKLAKPPMVQTVNDGPPLIVKTDDLIKTMPTQSELETSGPSTTASDGVPGNNDAAAAVNGSGKDPVSSDSADAGRDLIFDKPEFDPEFPGGLAALSRFLTKNLHAPVDELDPGSHVRVLAKFVVDKEGAVTGVEVMESGGAIYDNEVLRVMKKMPKWKPGRQNGRNVSVYYRIPVIFKAPE